MWARVGFAIVLAVALIVTSSGSVSAAPDLPQPVGGQVAFVVGLMNGGQADDATLQAHFSPAFLQQVSVAQLRSTIAQVDQATPQAVTIKRVVRAVPLEAEVLLANAPPEVRDLKIAVSKTAPHRIEGLLLSSGAAPVAASASLGDFAKRTRAIAPRGVSLLVARVRQGHCVPLAQHSADTPRALGSAFKLFVLSTVMRKIESGQLRWDTPVVVRRPLISLPSGTMQNAPVGSTLPLREVAARMIEISDNTAADHLIALVGRRAVEREQAALGVADPQRNAPFLTTRELFLFRTTARSRLSAYLALRDREARLRFLVREIDSLPLPTATAFASWVSARDTQRVEWYASPADLCRTLIRLSARLRKPTLHPAADILRRNPILSYDTGVWQPVAAKGGSEPGVLTVSVLVRRKRDGAQFVVSTMLNRDAAIDEGQAIELQNTVFALLAKVS